MPWCGHCKTLAPILDDIATARKGTLHVGRLNCEAGENAILCKALKVPGYPGIALYVLSFPLNMPVSYISNSCSWKNGEFKAWYTQDRTEERILLWADGFEEEDLTEMERDPLDVVALTGTSFRRHISRGNWLVDL